MKFKDILNATNAAPEVGVEDVIKKVDIAEGLISDTMKERLKTLAEVDEDSYSYTERGIKFSFANSRAANTCQIIEYHDKIIVEFRKIADNILEGTYNKLVSETVIDKKDLLEFFEEKTGIYLSYI